MKKQEFQVIDDSSPDKAITHRHFLFELADRQKEGWWIAHMALMKCDDEKGAELFIVWEREEDED